MSAQPAGLAVSVTVVNELQEEGGLTIVWLKATAESSSQSVACAWDWTDDGRLDTRPSLQTVVSHSYRCASQFTARVVAVNYQGEGAQDTVTFRTLPCAAPR